MIVPFIKDQDYRIRFPSIDLHMTISQAYLNLIYVKSIQIKPLYDELKEVFI